MTVRTIDFLPEIFNTPANQKFLGATMDQLVTEPNLKKLNGYVGRKFAPTYKSSDNYLPEVDPSRANYQLEPCVVSTDENTNVQFFSSYTDLIQKISHYGGITTDHSRMFKNETYSYDGLIDFDKLVNFNQYYWLPEGPKAVDIFSGVADDIRSFDVERNTEYMAYTLSGYGETQNPDLVMVRGGFYEFKVNQPGNGFWIQTNPGVSGTRANQANIDTRAVFGVTNNGADSGTVTFNVPQIDEQNFYVDMPLVQLVDFATTERFIDIDNQLVQNLPNGIDGISSELAGKYLIFVDNDYDDTSWDEKGIYGYASYGSGLYDEGTLVPTPSRGSIWQIQILDGGNATKLINLVLVQDIPIESKVFIKSGFQFANKEFYKNQVGDLVEVPLVTAPLDTLYYNDGTDQRFYGRIRLVSNDPALNVIDVDEEILGQKNYTSPNDVTFTNGLKVRFSSTVFPTEYANEEFYVEGVGTSIRLVSIHNLITPEAMDDTASVAFDIYGFDDDFFDQSLNGPLSTDYLTINRSSIDGNAWSRSNRWFHNDIILASAYYNNEVPSYDQLKRALRPIIEFDPDLKLFNSGRIAHHGVDVLDFTVTDAMNEVEGAVDSYFLTVNFTDGMTVIFARDEDPTVRNRIFKVNILDINGTTTIHLTEVEDGDIKLNDSIIPGSGTTVVLNTYDNTVSGYDPEFIFNPSVRTISPVNNLGNIPLDGVLSQDIGLLVGNSFWYNGTDWIKGQQKKGTNVKPIFDIVDEDFVSFGDQDHYNNTSFAGCGLFEYKPGYGANDPVLGFPVSYRNFNNVGDIEFENHFDHLTFTEVVGAETITHSVDTGFVPVIIDKETLTKSNAWVAKAELSKQYQIISKLCDGITSYFEIDIAPDEVTSIPNIKVFVNDKALTSSEFAIESVGVRSAVNVKLPLELNDKVDILIYSKAPSAIGYYEIPQNLGFNALNEKFHTLTLGQFRNHLVTLRSNSNQIIGAVPGASNLRDVNIKAQGGSILQHSAPAVYGSLFLINKDVNFIDSLVLAQKEYTRFKNLFLEMFPNVLDAKITDPSVGVDYILSKLNEVKNNLSPWYYSDMVPYDANRSTIEYTVLNTAITEYEIDTIFNDTELSNKAILVYLNGTQLLRGADYSFVQTRPSIKFNRQFEYDDIIQIRIFHNTDGCYIPETPTKLALYPVFTPEIYFDETYHIPLDMIRGHDGSLTPAFGDMRDALLLELEKRIYNNIKVKYNSQNFDIYTVLPGKFRNNDYTKAEFDQIVSRNFLLWVGNNRVDVSTNEWFASNNPWSWNYKKFRDPIDGELLPGYWRGIYKYFYDCDAPNMRPWELLGFSEEPAWWVDTYGPAPYTGGNLVLWGDLEAGLVRHGEKAGIRLEHARPGLSKIIPVTETGEPRAPDEFLTTNIISSEASGSYAIGDQGPAESAWRNSSEYPFAIQQAFCLMRPATYFGRLGSLQKYHRHNETSQIIDDETKQRITPGDLVINSLDTRNVGYLNWIADYIRSNGADPLTTIRSYVDSLEVRLGYKVAGFTDKRYLKVLAEQSSPSSTNESIIIPDENYIVHLHKSTPVDRVVYSAVIVTKSVAGYTVSGYNTENPIFTIIPSEPNSNQRKLVVGGTEGIVYNDYQRLKVVVPYGYEFRSKQQVVDFLNSYGRFLKSRGLMFEEYNQALLESMNWDLAAKEFLSWTEQGWDIGNIIVLSPVNNTINLEYPNAVADKITNQPLGSKVLDIGFNVISPSRFNVVREGNKFSISTMSEISIGLLDLSLVQYEHALIFDNTTLFNDVIYTPSLGNRQYRLKLIGNKTAAWDGQVSPPGFIYSDSTIQSWNAGQDYRKGDVVGYKTMVYTALKNVDASDTFDFNTWKQIPRESIKSGLLPNFAYNAKKFENMYDIDSQIADQNINAYGNGLIGYRDRSFLSDLGINATSQAKFYQGYIRDKGTKDAITALSTAVFNNLSGELEFNEEWAFRVGEYGATESNQFVEIQLTDSKYLYDPVALTLLEPGEVSESNEIIAEYKETAYKKSSVFKTHIFDTRSDDTIYENDIETAGYVHLNDIEATVFDINDLESMKDLIPVIHSGFKIWVAKDVTRDWNVYRINETTVMATDITYALDSLAYIKTNVPHDLQVSDVFAVRNFSTIVDGFYKVEFIEDINTVLVSITSELEEDMVESPEQTGNGTVFKLRSLRFDKLTDIIERAPLNGWQKTDKVWIDTTPSNQWKVYSKIFPWAFNSTLPGLEGIEADTDLAERFNNITLERDDWHYGQAVGLSPDGGIVAATAPGAYGNNLRLLVKLSTGIFFETSGITIPHDDDVTVGSVLSMNQNTIAISAVNSDDSSLNSVKLFTISISAISDDYEIVAPSAGKFGTAIAVSEDDKWLFVSDPAAGSVFCYTKNTTTNRFETLEATVSGPSIEGFGKSITANKDGSILIIGAEQATVGSMIGAGATYVFTRLSNVFTQKQKIEAPIATLGGKFGNSVCLVNNDLLIGAPNVNTNYYKSGFVYRYTFTSAIEPYVYVQEIKKPFVDFSEHFGTTLAADGDRLLVSSQGAYSLNEATLDDDTLTLDGRATRMIDRQRNAGAVYVYDLLTDQDGSKYSFNQQLGKATIKSGDDFGRSLAMRRGIAIVGSPKHDADGHSDNGRIQWFDNKTYSAGWEVTRYQRPKVDLDNVNRIFLYNSKNQTILANLDYIDPAKGKILGSAEQDIMYRTSFDPAVYNVGAGDPITIDASFNWGKSHVGQVWWNLDLVRYIDYEQDSLQYRVNNWGRLFPGAEIELYEWIESSVPPAQYTGAGTPKSVEYYVQLTSIDSTSGFVQSKYYFWVKDKNTVDTAIPGRRLPLNALTELIRTPRTQDVPFAALIQDNSISMYNTASYIAASTTVLHIDYTLLHNTNIIHNEYELVQDNSSSAVLPTKIVNKLIDSLTGEDAFSNPVPDYSLTAAERYGIGIRPRQTMLANRLIATKNVVQYVNSIFASTPIVDEFDISALYQAEEPPLTWDPLGKNISVPTLVERAYLDTELLEEGQRILVEVDSKYYDHWTIYEVNAAKEFILVRSQSYDTADYWEMINWFDPTFDPTVKPSFTVDTLKDISSLPLRLNDTIWVKNSGAGKFSAYRVDPPGALTLVGIEDGTIQLSDSLWAHGSNQIGFGADNFDTTGFALNPTVEYRIILEALRDSIFINTLKGEFQNLFFIVLNYIFSEQRMVDWAFKSSFVTILHRLRKLDQFPTYAKDNQSFYEDYVNEVKPYRTKVREYIINYSGSDDAQLHPTDFDLPSYYDTDLKTWRGPSGEHARDEVLLSTQPEYKDWNENHSYSIGEVLVSTPGYGYTSEPAITVEGGGGTGAVLSAVVDLYLGYLVKVIVLNPGSGYTSTPTIIVSGDGVDEGGNQTARCYPILTNQTTRKINSTVKFDRITYSSDIVQWVVGTQYASGNVVSYQSKAFKVNYGAGDTVILTTAAYFVPSEYTRIPDEDLESAADRVAASYAPTIGMPPKDLAQLFYGTEYPGNLVDGSFYTGDLPLDTNIQSFYTDLLLGQRPEDIDIDGAAYIDIFNSHAPEELLPGRIFDTLDIKVFTVDPNSPETNPIGYRISKTMGDDERRGDDKDSSWEFRRISAAHTTELAMDLNIGDTVIYVVDVSKLPVPGPHTNRPGTIYINGEKITYYDIDVATNSLLQIRRAAWGTGAPTRHIVGSIVCDASLDQKMPGNAHEITWLTLGESSIVLGDGLRGANTEQAQFLRNSPSYLPWLPGETGIRIDPNAYNTRFDDDGRDQYLTPIHPFDIDPFDSYDAG